MSVVDFLQHRIELSPQPLVFAKAEDLRHFVGSQPHLATPLEDLVDRAYGPRRSREMTHFCSLKLTHTKNTICTWARRGASDIIHAEGVRGVLPSSAPKARNGLSLQEQIACFGETNNHRGRHY